MWWIIALFVILVVNTQIGNSDDLLSKIMVFASFLFILGSITSNLFELKIMSLISELGRFAVIGGLILKVFKRIFIK